MYFLINYTVLWPSSLDTDCVSVQRVCKWRHAKRGLMTLSPTAVLWLLCSSWLQSSKLLSAWCSSPSYGQNFLCWAV